MNELPKTPADVEKISDLHAARSVIYAMIVRLAALEEEAARMRAQISETADSCESEIRRLSEAFDGARRVLENQARAREDLLARERSRLDERERLAAERERETARHEADLMETKARLQDEVGRVVRQYRLPPGTGA